MTSPVLQTINPRGPGPDTGVPLLENIRQPLYSSVAVNAGATIPARSSFFTYQVGDQVPGAGDGVQAASELHTNMDISSALPTPKVFVIDGIRIALNNLEGALTTPPVSPAAPGTGVHADLLDDLQRMLYGTLTTIEVGPKDYAGCPTFNFPMNAGVAGFSRVAIADAAAPEQILNQAFHSSGAYYSLAEFPIFIFSNQVFKVRLEAPQLTPPTFAIDRLITCFLEGILGREAM